MRAVPMTLREGSYAMGATRLQTALRVVMPAATSGIASAYILGISRAVGETMILAVAAGMQPNLTFNPPEPGATITSYIVQVALGDLPHGSIGYQTIFAAGLTLMLMTLMFNIARPLPAQEVPRGVLRWRHQDLQAIRALIAKHKRWDLPLRPARPAVPDGRRADLRRPVRRHGDPGHAAAQLRSSSPTFRLAAPGQAPASSRPGSAPRW